MINVLIVEDDPMVAELNKRYVESMPNFKIVGIAYNGEEGLQKLIDNKIDLVILDVYMEKLDGLQMLERIRKMGIITDVIFVTAAREANSIDEALKLGAVDYLIKPFDYERFKKALNNYINRFSILNHKDVFKQEDIDKITNMVGASHDDELKKGLHKKTLDRIRKFMSENAGTFLTSDEIATEVRLSKVTVRRYLEFLETIGEVKTEVEYGAVGRPGLLYKFSKDLF